MSLFISHTGLTQADVKCKVLLDKARWWHSRTPASVARCKDVLRTRSPPASSCPSVERWENAAFLPFTSSLWCLSGLSCKHANWPNVNIWGEGLQLKSLSPWRWPSSALECNLRDMNYRWEVKIASSNCLGVCVMEIYWQFPCRFGRSFTPLTLGSELAV